MNIWNKSLIFRHFLGVLRKFTCLPIFRILGRLTYGAFIVHLLVARVVLATVREPIFFGTGTMVMDNATFLETFFQIIRFLNIRPFTVRLYILRAVRLLFEFPGAGHIGGVASFFVSQADALIKSVVCSFNDDICLLHSNI